MRLYPKKLTSIADLEREKQLLLRETKQLDKEELFSLEGITDKGGDGAGSLLDMLPISNPLVAQVAKMVMARLTKKDKEPKATRKADDSEKKKSDSLLKKVALEFIGGYLKWKAVELSYKGIKHIIKKRKAREE